MRQIDDLSFMSLEEFSIDLLLVIKRQILTGCLLLEEGFGKARIVVCWLRQLAYLNVFRKVRFRFHLSRRVSVELSIQFLVRAALVSHCFETYVGVPFQDGAIGSADNHRMLESCTTEGWTKRGSGDIVIDVTFVRRISHACLQEMCEGHSVERYQNQRVVLNHRNLAGMDLILAFARSTSWVVSFE